MFDAYQAVTDTIVSKLETALQWEKPWISAFGGMQSGRPINAQTRKPYRGINVPLLWSTGFSNPYWGTFNTWKSLGAHVKKGSKSTSVVFWKQLTVKGGEEARDNGDDDGERTVLMARLYNVFNAEQVEGWTPKEKHVEMPSTTGERRPGVDEWIASRGVSVRHVSGDRAFYVPSADFVQLPLPEQFKAWEGYYCTAFHELGHATGHASRLSRDFSGRFGSEAYAFEELVAELSSAFLAADHGISPTPREDHAAYLKSWLRVLKSDKRAIFTAASKAEAAARWLHEQQTIAIAA